MEKIFLSDKLKKIIKKNKAKIEKALHVKIELKENESEVEGEALAEYTALRVFEALGLGFDINIALSLSDADNMFEKINIKDHVRSSRLKQVMGRVIGEKGKAKRVIAELSECHISISDNVVGLIGKIQNVSLASRAVKSLIRGSPHSSVYEFLERSQGKLHEASEDVLGKDEEEIE